MTIHLIHGFNVRDNGKGTVGRLKAPLEALGYDVKIQSYGWVFLLRLRSKNSDFVDELFESGEIKDGDIVICHSNGALITWKLLQKGIRLSQVICIQPALRRDTEWPSYTDVFCFFNKKDWIASLGRVWGRFVSTARPLRERHGWGSAGRHGFKEALNVVNIDTDVEIDSCHAQGHSGFFTATSCIDKINNIVKLSDAYESHFKTKDYVS